MIKSVNEFIEICQSDDPKVYTRFNNDLITDEIGFAIIAEYPEMADNVAENKTISLNMINHLANDEYWQIRSRIARKPNLTRELFEKFANDPHESVRHRLVYNKNTPLDILEKYQLYRSDVSSNHPARLG